MALPTASDNEFPKVILEEVADDGSATVTPAADHRALFLGEDGTLKLKDSAGAVTTAGGDVSAHTGDTSDAHDASAISVLDTAANFTGTDVEAVLAELQDNIDAGGGGATNLESAAYKRTSANYTTTSSTFADVDATNLALTKTTGARRVLVGFVGSVESSVSGDIVAFDIDIDGTRIGGTDGIVVSRAPGSGFRMNCSFTFMSDVLTAASHTFKLQWKRLAGTGTLTLHGASASQVSQFWITELYAD